MGGETARASFSPLLLVLAGRSSSWVSVFLLLLLHLLRLLLHLLHSCLYSLLSLFLRSYGHPGFPLPFGCLDYLPLEKRLFSLFTFFPFYFFLHLC